MCRIVITDKRNRAPAECKVIHTSVKSFSHVKTDLALIIVEHVPFECLEVITIDNLTCVEAPRLYVPVDLLDSACGDQGVVVTDSCVRHALGYDAECDLRFYWAREIEQKLFLVLQRSDGSFEVALDDDYDDNGFWKRVPAELEPFGLVAQGQEGAVYVDGPFESTVVGGEEGRAIVPELSESEKLGPTPTLNYMVRQYDCRYTKPATIRLQPIGDRFTPICDHCPACTDDLQLDENPWFVRKNYSISCHKNPHNKSAIDVKFEEYKKLTEQSLFHLKAVEDINVPLEVGPFPRDTHKMDASEGINFNYNCDSISSVTCDQTDGRGHNCFTRSCSIVCKQLNHISNMAVNIVTNRTTRPKNPHGNKIYTT